MGHDHSHAHGHSHSHDHASNAITKTIVIISIFMIVEFIAGYIASSLALIADASHSLSDVAAMGVSLLAIRIAKRPSTPQMSYGYQRAEILGALTSGLMIWAIVVLLVIESIERLQYPMAVNGPLVAIVGAVSILSNLLSMKILHPAQEGSINARAAYVHILSDLMGGAGALLAGLLIWFTGIVWIDPLITLFFAALMLYSSWGLIRDAIHILMESTPKDLDSIVLTRELKALPGVVEVHDLHVWSVTEGKKALSVHLVSTNDQILEAANTLLEDKYGIVHTTIQVEHPDRFRSDRCYDCT